MIEFLAQVQTKTSRFWLYILGFAKRRIVSFHFHHKLVFCFVFMGSSYRETMLSVDIFLNIVNIYFCGHCKSSVLALIETVRY